MDQDRQIRFAIPPFFLLASLLWGAHLAGCKLSLIIRPDNAEKFFGLLAASAVAIIPMGFLIGSLSVVLLRLIAAAFRITTYEAFLSEPTLTRIWSQLQTPERVNRRLTLYAAATFDHELLSPGIHAWLIRRWNSFNVATNSIVALGLAHVFAFILKIPQDFSWWKYTLFIVALFFVHAAWAWRETMAMIEFQSYRQQNPSNADVVETD